MSSDPKSVEPIPPIPPIPDAGKVPEPPPIPPIGKIPPVDTTVAPLSVAGKVTNTAAEPFLLKPVSDADLNKTRYAGRDINAVTPFIDGDSILTELENAITAAKSTVLIAFWMFDPQMKLKVNTAKTWGELIIDTAKKGVLVRIFWTDFDAGAELLSLRSHAEAWGRLQILVDAANVAGIPSDKFQVVCASHEAEINAALVGQFRPGIYKKIVTALNTLTPTIINSFFSLSPGLWEKVKLTTVSGNPVLEEKVAGKDYPVLAASHHQKMVIVDGQYGYAGGLNILDSYNDTRTHASGFPWHDSFVKMEGVNIISDMVNNYIGLWNYHRKRMETFITNALVARSPAGTILRRSSTDITSAMVPLAAPSTVAPAIAAQMRRTTSGSLSMLGAPTTFLKDVLDGYLLAISQAVDYIYIENQYFRDKRIGDAIIARHATQTNLRTIIVLPKEVEEIMNGKSDELSNHGSALQWEILDLMKSKIKDKLGLYTMIRKDKKPIYVHSKLMLVDDKFASIGSANSNPRSYVLDTELDLVWFDPNSVKQLRENLWKEMLGSPADLGKWKMKDYVKNWEKIAKANVTAKPANYKGFAQPFKNKDKGKKGVALMDPFV